MIPTARSTKPSHSSPYCASNETLQPHDTTCSRERQREEVFHHIVGWRLYILSSTNHSTDILVFFLQRPFPLGVRVVFRIFLNLIVVLAHVRCSNARRADQYLVPSFCDRKFVCSLKGSVAVALNGWTIVLARAMLEGKAREVCLTLAEVVETV